MSEAEVKIENESGNQKQWGREWFFQQKGFKRTARKDSLTAIACVLFIFSAVILVMTGETPPSATGQSNFMGQPTLNTSETLTVDSVPMVGSSNTVTQSGNRPLRKLSGPQVILRSKKLQIPPGTLGEAILISGASNGPTRAKLTASVDINGETLIPEGSVLVGQGSSSEERLFVQFRNVVFADGRFQPIQAQACEMSDKIVGLKGSRVGRYAMKMAGSIGLGFVGGLSEGLQETEVQGGVPVKSANLKNALLRGTSQAALDQSKELMAGIKEKAPIIEVKEGTPICILFEEN